MGSEGALWRWLGRYKHILLTHRDRRLVYANRWSSAISELELRRDERCTPINGWRRRNHRRLGWSWRPIRWTWRNHDSRLHTRAILLTRAILRTRTILLTRTILRTSLGERNLGLGRRGKAANWRCCSRPYRTSGSTNRSALPTRYHKTTRLQSRLLRRD